MRSFDWEGLKEELHQHFQECMSYVELGQPRDSMQDSFHPSPPSLERGEVSMQNSMCIRDLNGKESDLIEHVYFSDLKNYFTMFM